MDSFCHGDTDDEIEAEERGSNDDDDDIDFDAGPSEIRKALFVSENLILIFIYLKIIYLFIYLITIKSNLFDFCILLENTYCIIHQILINNILYSTNFKPLLKFQKKRLDNESNEDFEAPGGYPENTVKKFKTNV